MEAHVLGIGLYGPGLDGWANSAAVLKGATRYDRGVLPALETTLLGRTERRRAGRTVQLAVKVSHEATEQAQVAPSSVPSIFASCGGDLETSNELCFALSRPEKLISPTRFHNSVHNAAAGYWGIAAGANAASTSLSCFDDTFAAGLIEALCQLRAGAGAVLLVAYDYPAPEPLHAKRPMSVPFGVALLLSNNSTAKARANLRLTLEPGRGETSMTNADLEAIRRTVPAARSLPILRALAGSEPNVVALAYLDTLSLKIEVQPCR